MSDFVKNRFLPLLFVFFSLLFFCGCLEQTTKTAKIAFENSSATITAEIADTQESRAVGLMNRQQLDTNNGMLFIFQNNDYHTFWMKNTLVPLDMIFIDENLKIVDVLQADPCRSDPCPVYVPKDKARYVLEVNQNWTKNNEIIIDSRINLTILSKV